ncbi:uncharacterized protein TNCV_3375521 [Trichonephila clavipes]|nr:uncharacterized protein TNCV_3375521 [Trichonephila clavipes]
MDFARWSLHESNADRNFAASVLFTDEAAFLIEGCDELSQPAATWADESPHAIRPHGAQRKCSINVWAGIVGDCLLGPYILPGKTYYASVYLTFLQREFSPEMLNNVPMPYSSTRIRFQHDGGFCTFQHRRQSTSAGYFSWRLDWSRWTDRMCQHDHQICLPLIFSCGDF